MKFVRRDAAYWFLFSLSAVIVLPIVQLLATGPIGGALPLFLATTFCGGVLLCVVVAIPILGITALRGSHRKDSLRWIGVAVACTLTLSIALIASEHVRMNRIRAFCTRALPLTDAIHAYTIDHEQPPDRLEQLLPDYLSTMPNTGMSAYPEFRYLSGEEAQKFADHEWVLYIPTSNGILNFDKIIYLPSENYPEHGFGGWLEQLGSWAYVHE